MKSPVHFVSILALFALPFVAFAASSGHEVISDVPYLEGARDEKLDVYLPKARPAGALTPGFVWLHGGGWMRGDKGDRSAKQICATLAEAGYVAVSINYRIGAGSWPQNMRDAQSAVRFLRANAAQYGVDPERIGIGGGSAGAHLALMAAFTVGRPEFEPPITAAGGPHENVSSAVRCVLDLYGPTALGTREAVDAQGKPTGKRRPPANSIEAFGPTRGSYDGNTVEFFVSASPVTYVSRRSPPVLILQGTIDSEVDPGQPKTLAAVLTQHKVPHEVIFVEGAGHGFDFESWNNQPLSRDIRSVALAFLAKHLGPPKR